MRKRPWWSRMSPTQGIDLWNSFSERDLALLKPEELEEALQLLEEMERLALENRIDSFYPDHGPLRRELYPRHLEFFAAGVTHRERCFLAAIAWARQKAWAHMSLRCTSRGAT